MCSLMRFFTSQEELADTSPELKLISEKALIVQPGSERNLAEVKMKVQILLGALESTYKFRRELSYVIQNKSCHGEIVMRCS